ncbi:hypothetical protein OAI_11455 [Vibrio cyclitrophicus FF160]|uniref:hypothetical protein n=1 Tax=Vibrio cyclitrophicus TaxID=47951 RepID=UPI0002F14054|nr:hypothetical protein [Vibrio cyclitrophicus]OEE81585.1 hypothetical protein OAI_11455 [Vibrio cyclitrophicus FF160]
MFRLTNDFNVSLKNKSFENASYAILLVIVLSTILLKRDIIQSYIFIFCFSIGIVLLLVDARLRYSLKTYALIAILFFIFSIPILQQNQYTIGNWLVLVLSMVFYSQVTNNIYHNPLKARSFFSILLLLYSLWIFWNFSVYSNFDWAFFVKYSNRITEAGSRNILGYFLTSLYLIYVYLSYVCNKKTSTTLSLLCIFCAFILFGRSTIITVAIVFLFDKILFDLLKSRLKIVLLFALFIVILGFSFELINWLTNNTNFSEGVDSPRNQIVSEYLSEMTLQHLLLGSDPCQYPIIYMHSCNPHNSYLLLNINFGFLGLIIIALLSILSILLFKHSRKEALIYIAFLFRIYFEPVFFTGWFSDIIIYMVIFRVFKFKRCY